VRESRRSRLFWSFFLSASVIRGYGRGISSFLISESTTRTTAMHGTTSFCWGQRSLNLNTRLRLLLLVVLLVCLCDPRVRPRDFLLFASILGSRIGGGLSRSAGLPHVISESTTRTTAMHGTTSFCWGQRSLNSFAPSRSSSFHASLSYALYFPISRAAVRRSWIFFQCDFPRY
jgi:hypothetical protein